MANGKITPELIAPCGMNCGICKAYLSYSRGIPKEKGKVTHCSGCVPRNKLCFIKRGCRKLRQDKIRFCSECEDMPCENVDRIDRRYRNRYGMSMVENLIEIKSTSLQSFIMNQETKYRCPNCGDIISVHDRKCYSCLKQSLEDRTDQTKRADR